MWGFNPDASFSEDITIAYDSRDTGRVVPAGGNWIFDLESFLPVDTHRFLGPHTSSGDYSYDVNITFVPTAAVPETASTASVFAGAFLVFGIGRALYRRNSKASGAKPDGCLGKV